MRLIGRVVSARGTPWRDDGRRAVDLLLGTVDAPLIAGRLLDGPEWQLRGDDDGEGR